MEIRTSAAALVKDKIRDQPSNGEESDEDLQPGEQPRREQSLEQNLHTGEGKERQQLFEEKKKRRKHQRDL